MNMNNPEQLNTQEDRDELKTTIQEVYEHIGDKESGVPPLFTFQAIIESIDTKRVKSIKSVKVDYDLQEVESNSEIHE